MLAVKWVLAGRQQRALQRAHELGQIVLLRRCEPVEGIACRCTLAVMCTNGGGHVAGAPVVQEIRICRVVDRCYRL